MSGRKKRFTIIVIPHSESSVFSFPISLSFLQIVSTLILALIILLLVFVNSYEEMRSQVSELETLRVINRRQNEEIAFLTNETILLKKNMESLAQLDQQLRQMMNMDAGPVAVSVASARGGGQSVGLEEYAVEEDLSLADALQAKDRLAQIRAEMEIREESLGDLVNAVAAQQQLLDATPSIWPAEATITSWFGYRRSPFGSALEFHGGLDMAAPYGTPVVATANGVVAYAGWRGAYGKFIEVEHGYGFQTNYGHLSRIVVRSGQQVTRGQVIGYVGSTGRSTGSHLHYEVIKNGRQVNPRYYLSGPLTVAELVR